MTSTHLGQELSEVNACGAHGPCRQKTSPLRVNHSDEAGIPRLSRRWEVQLNGKLIGDICDNELFLMRTPTSDRLLADSELRYPYEGSKTLMHVFDRFEDTDLAAELLEGMYAELPEKAPKKVKRT